MEKFTIYVWPDDSWVSEEDIDDMDWYLSSSGKSDDYAAYEIPLELEPDDIEELIELKALPGMLPDVLVTAENIIAAGEIKISPDDIVIISHAKDIDYNAVTMLEDKLIVNAPDLTLKIIKGKK